MSAIKSYGYRVLLDFMDKNAAKWAHHFGVFVNFWCMLRRGRHYMPVPAIARELCCQVGKLVENSIRNNSKE